MSKMGDHRIEGYYDFVVPPLDGFDYSDKSTFQWISGIPTVSLMDEYLKVNGYENDFSGTRCGKRKKE